MTEPERTYRCSVCGLYHQPGECQRRLPHESLLVEAYGELRLQCIQIEEVIAASGADNLLTLEELTRLDKAVTVMKVGFKLVKKVLAKRGHTGIKKAAIERRATAPAGEPPQAQLDALQALADNAQELGLGYEPPAPSEQG
jgi:hypothetical protein